MKLTEKQIKDMAKVARNAFDTWETYACKWSNVVCTTIREYELIQAAHTATLTSARAKVTELESQLTFAQQAVKELEDME